MPPGLASLLIATAGRDQAAYERLVTTAGPWLAALAGKVAGPDLAADAVQDVLVDCWFHGRRFSVRATDADPVGDRAAGAWLARLVVRAVLDRQRGERRRHAREHHMAPSEPVPDATQSLPDRWLIAESLDSLSEADRTALSLHAGGATAEDIGGTMRCSPGAARVRVHRALGRLRAALSRRGAVVSAVVLAAWAEPLSAIELTASDLVRWSHAPQTTTAPPLIHLPTLGSPLMPILVTSIMLATVTCGAWLATDPAENHPATPNPAHALAIAATPPPSPANLADDLFYHPIDLTGLKPGNATLTIHEIAGLIQTATGQPTSAQAKDANGIVRDGMTFGCSPQDHRVMTILDFLVNSGANGYWRLAKADHGLHLIPTPVGPRRVTEKERLLAWAYLPLEIDGGAGMSLGQLETELSRQLAMPVRLVPLVPPATDPARLERPVLIGRITGLSGRQLVGKLVAGDYWNVEYNIPDDPSFQGVRMSFTPRDEVITPRSFQ